MTVYKWIRLQYGNGDSSQWTRIVDPDAPMDDELDPEPIAPLDPDTPPESPDYVLGDE